MLLQTGKCSLCYFAFVLGILGNQDSECLAWVLVSTQGVTGGTGGKVGDWGVTREWLWCRLIRVWSRRRETGQLCPISPLNLSWPSIPLSLSRPNEPSCSYTFSLKQKAASGEEDRAPLLLTWCTRCKYAYMCLPWPAFSLPKGLSVLTLWLISPLISQNCYIFYVFLKSYSKL